MKFLKLYLFKFSRWWKYLFFAGLFFLVGNNVFATTVLDGFNNYNLGNLVNQGDWKLNLGVAHATVETKSGNDKMAVVRIDNNDLSKIYKSFSLGSGNILCWDFLPNKSSGYFSVDSIVGNNITKIEITPNHTNNTFQIRTQNPNETWNFYGLFPDTQWIHACFRYNNVDHLYEFKAGNNQWTDKIGYRYNQTVTNFVAEFYGNNTNRKLYFDNIELGIINMADNITFINPEENGVYNYAAPITSPNYFSWHFNFSFSTTTAELYGSDYPLISVSFEKPGSFTPTIFEVSDLYTLLDINWYVENPSEGFAIDRKVSNYPPEEGDYTVIATLWNTYYSSSQGKRVLDKLLATAEINKFTITSATSTTPTAWCSGLCADIATSTNLLGEIGNGVNCALRSAACYLFYPHNFAINGVLDQAAIIQTKFPASTYFDLTNAIASATESTTYQNSFFGFPAARKTGTSTEFYIIPVISSSTLSHYVGTTNANNIRLGFTTFLYCLTGLLIIFLLI